MMKQTKECTGFLWKMIEHGYDPDESSPESRRRAKENPTEFVTSPTMAGGLFAANTDFFLNDLGGYDEMFEYWGTENLELSFRLWMCGGSLECAPCSRAYHIFRKGGVGYAVRNNVCVCELLAAVTTTFDDEEQVEDVGCLDG